MFRGINKVSLDGKSRMALPARLRETLQQASAGKIVLTIDYREKCLMLYPQPTWEKLQDTITDLPNRSEQVRHIQRCMIGYATELEPDAQGRVLIPALLCDHANLDKKLILLGLGNKVEVWSEPLWNQRREALLDSEAMKSLDNLEELSGLSI